MRQPGLLAVLLVVGCGAAAQPAKPPPKPRAPIASVPGSFWQETPVDDPTLQQVAWERDRLVRAELAERFDALPEASRERLIERGVLAVGREREASLGSAYVELAKKHVPYVITLDALFSITFRAMERALDEVDREAIAPALPQSLARVDEALAAESRAARSDTAGAYAIALGVVEVARKLLDPAIDLPRQAPPEVGLELSRILAHAGPAKSALLERTIDYGAFDTQAGLALDDARLPQFRAMTWLERAALALAAEPAIDHAVARTQTRAAMLLARTSNDLFAHIVENVAFASGRGDDPGAAELSAAATKLGIELRDESTIGNVVRVDQLRGALVRGAAPTVEDTGGTLPTFRLLSPSAPPDARAISLLPHPNALAVGVALGSPEARTLVEDGNIEEIAQLFAQSDAERHASLHASGLDAIAIYLAPSAYDAQRPWRETTAYKRRKLEVALAAWATLRHASVAFARDSARAVLDEPEPVFEDVPGAIEPHPETIARLLSLVRQTRRGLVVRGGLREAGAAMQLLDRVESFLGDALSIAMAQATAPLTATHARVLASMPSRLVSIERRLGPAAAPLVVVTAADLALGRVLEDATGDATELWLAVDVAGAPQLYVGARIPFHEVTSTLRATDASWTKQLASAPPPKLAWVEPFLEP